jgi:hypothetical protein
VVIVTDARFSVAPDTAPSEINGLPAKRTKLTTFADLCKNPQFLYGLPIVLVRLIVTSLI